MNLPNFNFTKFPDLTDATEDGVIAFGGSLSFDLLLSAYVQGIFPWPINEEDPMLWFAPDPRGVIDFSEFHIPRSLAKEIKRDKFEVKFNNNFIEVINLCAAVPRSDHTGTWITDEIISAYTDLHQKGLAYSVETYLDNELVGGIYGVRIKKFVSGESMFFLEPNASKIALVFLIKSLLSEGITWLDTQMISPIVESLGGKEISRNEFMKRLTTSLN